MQQQTTTTTEIQQPQLSGLLKIKNEIRRFGLNPEDWALTLNSEQENNLELSRRDEPSLRLVGKTDLDLRILWLEFETF